eukprot:3625927-Lingulodinium_polyedra.AAC.1
MADTFDWVCIECVTAFDDEAGLAALRGTFNVHVLRIDPSLLGMPCKRLRKYMLLTRARAIIWDES